MPDSSFPVSSPAGWRLDHSYARLPAAFHTRVDPTPVREPKMVVFNGPLAESLGLETSLRENAAIFAGNALPPGAHPLTQAYAGHQYGHFTMLGDGRAILLGEQMTPSGERFDIQLKGPGPTPFSRRGDGRAALGPMLREYIISEAMFALGIPTTRSLAVVTTGEPVYRETTLPGAVLTRVAASHIRVGTFEYAAALNEKTALQALADHTLQRHYPEIAGAESRYLAFLEAVIERQ
ncbi:MAG: protein adenylyltransferase SelO family protein, partial [Prosthecobacter sp.]|nr:protein adenylyltransferase SelO family protein [Prosthecobacter sp.]